MVEVAKDIERLCPNALFINFTNPMTVNVWAVSKATRARVGGLFTAPPIGAFSPTVRWPWERGQLVIGVNRFTGCGFRPTADARPSCMSRRAREAQAGVVTAASSTPSPASATGICEFVPGWRGGAYMARPLASTRPRFEVCRRRQGLRHGRQVRPAPSPE